MATSWPKCLPNSRHVRTSVRTPALAPVEVVLRDLGIKEPEGIDLEIIAWHLGATIKYARLGSCEACIVGNSCNAVICVDERKSVERQRFSIGHELGHWHHHRGKHLICRADDIARGSERRLERQADEYAGDLILPNPILAACLGDYGKMVNLTMLRELRNRFQASLTSIAIGITKTNRFPLAVVCSRGDGRVWAARSQCLSKFWRLRQALLLLRSASQRPIDFRWPSSAVAAMVEYGPHARNACRNSGALGRT